MFGNELYRAARSVESSCSTRVQDGPRERVSRIASDLPTAPIDPARVQLSWAGSWVAEPRLRNHRSTCIASRLPSEEKNTVHTSHRTAQRNQISMPSRAEPPHDTYGAVGTWPSAPSGRSCHLLMRESMRRVGGRTTTNQTARSRGKAACVGSTTSGSGFESTFGWCWWRAEDWLEARGIWHCAGTTSRKTGLIDTCSRAAMGVGSALTPGIGG